MTKQQKIILIILGLLDLAVISGLVFVVITGKQTPSTPLPLPTGCQLAIAEGLQPDFAITFNQSTLSATLPESEITLNAMRTANQAVLEDGQILWLFMERLAPIVTKQCEDTTHISVRFTASNGHYFIIKTADLLRWHNHDIDDALFSERIQYQMIRLPSSDIPE